MSSRKKSRKDSAKEIVSFGILIVVLLILATVLPYRPPPAAQLSELQAMACNTADMHGTCNSRLAEVGIVLSEECCQALGKCCG